MNSTQQLVPGMAISLDGKIYRVESCVKVTVAKGNPFVKAKLRDLIDGDTVEKNFKLGQAVNEVVLSERKLEYLYLEGKDYLFLDVGTLDQVAVPSIVIGEKVNFLKEGIDVKAMGYGDTVFAVELPQFLELMVVKTEPAETAVSLSSGVKKVILETGAKIDAPLFVETGDIVKIDTQTGDYIQRV